RRRTFLAGEEVRARLVDVVRERLEIDVRSADALITVEPLRAAERATPLHRTEERLHVVGLIVAQEVDPFPPHGPNPPDEAFHAGAGAGHQAGRGDGEGAACRV